MLLVLLPATALASAYNAQPKLIVVITIDQFRGDYLERYRSDFGAGGFRILLERGAVFNDCYFDDPVTFTAAGHATIFTGAYPVGHGIFENEWYDPARKKMVSSVDDDKFPLVGSAMGTPAMSSGSTVGSGASPKNLLATTLGDEMKLATGGRSRVFAISLKDRSAILPAGFAADGAYWIDATTGVFITSSFYQRELPAWVAQFNAAKPAEKFWDKDWTDASGRVLRHTSRTDASGKPAQFYNVVGPTSFSSQYEFDFARALITAEKLGEGNATDLLSLSLSGHDLLGHQLGPDAPEMRTLALQIDRQLADFFNFLGQQIGLANVWVVLTADHGVSPTTAVAQHFRLPAPVLQPAEIAAKANAALAKRFGPGNYVHDIEWPVVYVSPEAFASKAEEADAERAAGEELKQLGVRSYFTKQQLAAGQVPNDAWGRRFRNGYSPHGGWWLLAAPPPFTLPGGNLTSTHGSAYSYDTHVPLVFMGLPFRSGTYRTAAEPVDMAVTLSSLLGINKPSQATGRVLTEMLSEPNSK